MVNGSVAEILGFMIFIFLYIAYLTHYERKFIAKIHRRVGPSR